MEWGKIIAISLITLLIHGFAFEFVPMFLAWLRNNPDISVEYKKEVAKRNPRYDLLNIIPGVLERAFFTIVVIFNLGGAAIGMIGWITLKMATNWNRDFKDIPEGLTPEKKSALLSDRTKMALCSLYASLFSLSFSLVSGLIIRGAFIK